MATSGLAQRIERLIAPALEDMGYEIVRARLTGGERRVLQIMAERIDRAPMNVDRCAEISRAVSAILGVEDPVPGAYTLEISSPGIDRPLVHERDFERFTGHEAKIETKDLIDGRRRFRGRLLGNSGTGVRIAIEDGEMEVPFEAIAQAKLVLTDELLAGAEADKEQGA